MKTGEIATGDLTDVSHLCPSPCSNLSKEPSSNMLSMVMHNLYKQTKNKLLGLSPQAKYTDRATVLAGEVSVNFSGWRMSRGQHNEYPRPLISVF
jgi:hypothetical protein